MPFVSCSAKHCVYNTQNACGRTSLTVAGCEADRPAATCCESFSATGCCEQPQPDRAARIACAAAACRYNKSGSCEAGSIDIAGSKARCPAETECDTFCK